MLNEHVAKEYWEERASQFGEAAVGFNSGLDSEKQEEEYRVRKKFIFNFLSREYRTLDYGCGIGRYSADFTQYMGVDMTKTMIKMAEARNPKGLFVSLLNPWITNKFEFPEMVFTATVLQHCNSILVSKIVDSFHNLPNLKKMAFYEKNNGDQKPHVISRTTKDYLDIIEGALWKVIRYTSHTHTVHGENHTLSVFTVKDGR